MPGTHDSAEGRRASRDWVHEHGARLQRFIRERPFALRQPVSSIVFTAVDRIQANPRETAATLVSLLDGDTALSREEVSGPEEKQSPLSVPGCAPLGSAAPLPSEEEPFSSASRFLRERLSGPWKDEVRRREEDVLEAHVRAFERRRCGGESLHRNKGFSIVHQSNSVVERLETFYCSCSPFYLAAFQVAAMQLRSLILADELLQSLCGGADSEHQANQAERTLSSFGESKTPSTASDGVLAGEDQQQPNDGLRAELNERITYFWQAANIEAEEQQKRFGYVEGAHDVEKAEALLWLHAAALVVKFA